MRHATWIAFALFSACDFQDDTGKSDLSDGGGWTVTGLSLGRDALNYAEVSGTITLDDSYAGIGAQAEVRYYLDDYQTLIVATEQFIGGDLEESGQTQAFEITHYEVYVTPATGGYSKVCAEFRAEDSNHGTWERVGCLE